MSAIVTLHGCQQLLHCIEVSSCYSVCQRLLQCLSAIVTVCQQLLKCVSTVVTMCVSHCYSVSAVVTMCQQLLQCVSTSVSVSALVCLQRGMWWRRRKTSSERWSSSGSVTCSRLRTFFPSSQTLSPLTISRSHHFFYFGTS